MNHIIFGNYPHSGVFSWISQYPSQMCTWIVHSMSFAKVLFRVRFWFCGFEPPVYKIYLLFRFFKSILMHAVGVLQVRRFRQRKDFRKKVSQKVVSRFFIYSYFFLTIFVWSKSSYFCKVCILTYKLQIKSCANCHSRQKNDR